MWEKLCNDLGEFVAKTGKEALLIRAEDGKLVLEGSETLKQRIALALISATDILFPNEEAKQDCTQPVIGVASTVEGSGASQQTQVKSGCAESADDCTNSKLNKTPAVILQRLKRVNTTSSQVGQPSLEAAEQPTFVCDVCSKVFRRPHKFRDHVFICHQNESSVDQARVAQDSVAQGSVVQISAALVNVAKDSAAQVSLAQDSAAQVSTAQVSAAQNSAAQNSAAQNSAAQSSAAQNSAACVKPESETPVSINESNVLACAMDTFVDDGDGSPLENFDDNDAGIDHNGCGGHEDDGNYLGDGGSTKVSVEVPKEDDSTITGTAAVGSPTVTLVQQNAILKSKVQKIEASRRSLKKKYSCKVCGWCFDKTSKLKRHMRGHGVIPTESQTLNMHILSSKKSFFYSTDLRKRYPCLICGWRFSLPYQLKRHSKQHSSVMHLIKKGVKVSAETNTDVVEIKEVKERFTTEEMKRLPAFCSDPKKFECEACGWQFSKPNKVLAHIRRHSDIKVTNDIRVKLDIQGCRASKLYSRDPAKKNECFVCGWRFHQSFDMKKHISSRHRRTLGYLRQGETTGSAWKCDDEPVTTCSQEAEINEPCTDDGQIGNDVTSETSVATADETDMTCAPASDDGNNQRHSARLKGKKLCFASLVPPKFKVKGSQELKEGEQTFSTEIEASTFEKRNSEQMKASRYYCNDPAKKFSCLMCGWRFTNYSLLKDHLNHHNDLNEADVVRDVNIQQCRNSRWYCTDPAKLFACVHCGWRFSKRDKVVVHIEKRHSFFASKDGILVSQVNHMLDSISFVNVDVPEVMGESPTVSHVKTSLGEDVEKQAGAVDTDMEERNINDSVKELEGGNTDGNVLGTSGSDVVQPGASGETEQVDTHHVTIVQESSGICETVPLTSCGVEDTSSSDAKQSLPPENLDMVKFYEDITKKKVVFKQPMCQACGQVFNTEQTRDAHVEEEHGAEQAKPFSCNQCSIEVTTHDQLTTHMKKKHDKPHKCSLCGKQYRHHGSLVGHQLSGCGLAQRCDYCQEFFATPREVINHCQQYHQEEIKCEYCNESFVRKSHMRKHLEVDHPESAQHSCVLCEHKFFSEKALEQHCKNVHRVARDCELCGKSFRHREHLNRHYKTHEGYKPYKCTICVDRGYGNQSALREHMRRKHPAEIGCEFKCKVCLRVFPSGDEQQLHESSAHQDQHLICDQCGDSLPSTRLLQIHIRKHNEQKKRALKMFPCSQCEFRAATRTLLKYHMLSHSDSRPHVCEICGKAYKTKRSLTDHLTVHNERDKSCHICKKKFNNERTFKEHVQGHTHRPEKCDVCDKGFVNKYAVKVHRRRHFKEPNTEPRHACPFCELKFKTKPLLRTHVAFHTDVPFYNCQVCNKLFKIKSEAMAHIQRHGNIKLYHTCYLCNVRYENRTELKNHWSEHAAINEYLVRCEHCNKGFFLMNNYKKHTIIHTQEYPYKCKMCDKGYRSNKGLHVHIRSVHTGEKPYSCPHCNKSFSSSVQLKNHVVIHTREERYKCRQCCKRFMHTNQRLRHERMCTG